MTAIPEPRRHAVWVRCARVPGTLPALAVTRWLAALPESGRSALASRLSRTTGIASLTGLALLASLSSACCLPPLDQLRWTRRGKPYFPDGPHFSIAHSGGIAACAVASSGQTVGIDVERVGRARMATIRLVASDEEQDAVENGCMTATELWTAKEAVLKAAGAGLTDIRRVRIEADRARFAGVEYHLRTCRLNEDCLLTIAMERRIPDFVVEWPPSHELFRLPGELAA